MNKRKVTIIGGGFSGLASAYYLSRSGFDVEIHEASPRVGGLISTRRVDHGLVETAANGFLNSYFVEELFRDLNVPLQGTRSEARKRFIFRQGRALRWPLGILASLHVAWFGLRFLLAKATVQPRPQETIEAWGDRVLGREACRYLLSTALQGIYAGNAAKMSASLIVGRLFKSQRRRAPSLKGTVAPKEGMQQLIDALEKDLRARGVQIHLNSKASAAAGHPTIIATPAKAAVEYVDSERAQALRKVEMNPVATTTAFFERTDEKSKGFGVLFPPGEGKFLGVLKNNFIFENRGTPFSETWIRGSTAPDGQIVFDIMSERRRVFGLEENPLEAVVTNWPEAIPHYTVELEKVIGLLNTPRDNVFLMGNYLGDLGLAKILERAASWPERLEREGRWT